MKSEFTISLVLLLLSVHLFAQEENIAPEMNAYTINHGLGDRTKANLPTTYWENGNIDTEYVDLEDERKIRKEYFESGKLKLEIEVIRTFTIDTFVSFDPDTYEESIEIVLGFTDIPDGKYVEYFEAFKNPEKAIRTKGQFTLWDRTGEWIHQTEIYGSILMANYKNGVIDGKFIEYYPSLEGLSSDKERKIYSKGKYSYTKYKKESSDYWRQASLKTGEWYYFNFDGTVTEKINYDTDEVEDIRKL